MRQQLYPLQVGYRKRGQSGIEISDWWPHLGDCIDDLAVVRSMWTTDNNHGAQLQYHTGRHSLEGAFPTIGSWVHYGLGSLNDNLPQFVVLGTPLGRLLRRRQRPRRRLPRTRAPRRFAQGRSEKSAALRLAGRGQIPRGTEGRVRPARPAQPPVRHRVPRRPGPAGAHQVLRTGVPHAIGPAGSVPVRARDGGDAAAVRPGSTRRRGILASSAWRRGGWSRAACASCRSSTAATAARVPGTRTADSRPTIRRFVARLISQSRHCLKDLKRRGLLDETLVVLGHRVRPHTGRPGRRRPRSSSVRLLDVAGRRRHQGRHRPRRHRRTRLPRRRESPLRHRHPRHGVAPTRTRPAPLGRARPQAVGDRVRQTDRGNHRLRSLSALASPPCVFRRVRRQ